MYMHGYRYRYRWRWRYRYRYRYMYRYRYRYMYMLMHMYMYMYMHICCLYYIDLGFQPFKLDRTKRVRQALPNSISRSTAIAILVDWRITLGEAPISMTG